MLRTLRRLNRSSSVERDGTLLTLTVPLAADRKGTLSTPGS
jgi:hypothetical protein